ncbi:putative disease resistance RPP13-like protein 1 [Coffea arabica]|uniref:Disease resistance RPP13-like protein 1 n=1 Tax=Coffea arabica TaxID=13443 RepID=A0A6P6WX41_COFAR|nr:putative disease resistance protein RGA4 [Coffea arabica]
MAENLLMSASVEVLLQKIISVTTENINLVFGGPQEISCLMENWFSHSSEETNVVQAIRQELEELKGSLSNIQAVSQDNLRLQDKAVIVTLWLQKLSDLADDADNALAEFGYQILQHEVEMLNQEKPKVSLFSCHSDKKAFRQEMMPKARGISNKLEMINKEVKDFLASEKYGVTTASSPQVDVVQEVGFLIADLKITENEEKTSIENFWSIIKEKAGVSDEIPIGLKDIGRHIAEKCQGLSLAANLLGGLLQNKRRDFWLSILESGVLDKEDVISAILKLCFENLPSPFLKRCFAFCSMFPRNSVIERDQLVQLWMAEGFIDPGLGISVMEEIGNQYFDTLLQNSLLEIVSKDNFNKVTHCKLHNLVYDFAYSLSSFESITIGERDQDDIRQIQHLALESFTEETMKIAKEKARYLRTLFLKKNLPDNNLLNLNFLYVLNLCDADIAELPVYVGNLRHLEYLDLSRTEIKSIPDSACNLYKLKTLRIIGCNSLEELPKDFKNLLCLRHLHFYYNEYFSMPYEFGRLSHLQTLPIYNVGKKCGPPIGELKHLKDLKGKLEIRNLDLVKDKKEAQLANLFEKPNLQELELRWIDPEKEEREDPNNDENVLEGLEPYHNLKSLRIEHFKGDRFPSWVMKMSVKRGSLQLNNLVEVKLESCTRCKEIPTLGTLPLLQNLEIVKLSEVSCFGSSFYGGNGSNTNTSETQATKSFFPALKSLIINNMRSLLDWKGPEEISASYEAKTFNSLERLFLRRDPKLMTAPSHFPALKVLRVESIKSSSPLESICNSKLTTLTSLHVEDVQELTSLPDELLENNTNLSYLCIIKCHSLTHIVPHMSGCSAVLQELEIKECGALQEFPPEICSLRSLKRFELSYCPSIKLFPNLNGQGGLPSLQSLTVSECQGLISIPSEVLESCKSLQYLWVTECENLIEFSPNFQQMPNISFMRITSCPKLNTMPKGLGALSNLADLRMGPLSNSMEFETFQTCFTGLQQLSSLVSLFLVGQHHWNSLPEELQHLTALKEMTLYDFGIEVLPDWIGNLSSIQSLALSNCRKLESFPSKEIMEGLKNMEYLDIEDCNLLARKWMLQNEPDSEWFKVSHIKLVILDYEEVSDPIIWNMIHRMMEKRMQKRNNEEKKKKKKKTKKTKKKTNSSTSTS